MADPKRPLNVLLIDDDEDVRALLETMIEVDEQVQLVASTGSPVEGVRLAAVHGPDVVVVDLDLPAMEGFDVLPLLRRASDAVVVVFSAFPDPYTLLEATERGADVYVDKGRTWAELIPAIEAACSDCAAPPG